MASAGEGAVVPASPVGHILDAILISGPVRWMGMVVSESRLAIASAVSVSPFLPSHIYSAWGE